MLHLLLDLLIQPLEPLKLSTPRCAELWKAVSLMILPSVEVLLAHAYLNHAAKADSNSSSSEYFNDFWCLEEFPCWVVAQYLTVVFMWTLEVQTLMPGQPMFQYVPQLLLKYLSLSLILNDSAFFYTYFVLSCENTLSPQYTMVYKVLYCSRLGMPSSTSAVDHCQLELMNLNLTSVPTEPIAIYKRIVLITSALISGEPDANKNSEMKIMNNVK